MFFFFTKLVRVSKQLMQNCYFENSIFNDGFRARTIWWPIYISPVDLLHRLVNARGAWHLWRRDKRYVKKSSEAAAGNPNCGVKWILSMSKWRVHTLLRYWYFSYYSNFNRPCQNRRIGVVGMGGCLFGFWTKSTLWMLAPFTALRQHYSTSSYLAAIDVLWNSSAPSDCQKSIPLIDRTSN